MLGSDFKVALSHAQILISTAFERQFVDNRVATLESPPYMHYALSIHFVRGSAIALFRCGGFLEDIFHQFVIV